MTIKHFIELLTQELEHYFPPEDYELRSDQFLKNNDTNRHGIVIKRIRGNIAPTVYVDHFFEDYLKKKNTIEEIACQIQAAIHSFDQKEERYRDFSAEFDDCKPKIIYRLVSREKNTSYLASMPHLPFLNLAIIFLIVHQLSEEGLESVCITNDLQKKWNISTKELYVIAARNTPRLFPPSIDTMEHTIEKIFNSPFDTLVSSGRPISPMYILSNQYGINGAAVLLYENLIQEFAEQEQCNFYILPSSIHEILLIPDISEKSLSYLSQMVREINRKHVKEDEILSDCAYYYDREEKRFLL